MALREDDLPSFRELLGGERFTKPVRLVEGGDTRQESVDNALAAVAPDTDLVAVHDAVRPFIDEATLASVIEEAAKTGAAIVGIVPVDTVKQVRLQQDPRHHSARAPDPGADPAGLPL